MLASLIIHPHILKRWRKKEVLITLYSENSSVFVWTLWFVPVEMNKLNGVVWQCGWNFACSSRICNSTNSTSIDWNELILNSLIFSFHSVWLRFLNDVSNRNAKILKIEDVQTPILMRGICRQCHRWLRFYFLNCLGRRAQQRKLWSYEKNPRSNKSR